MFGAVYQKLMEVRHWTAEQINRMTLYQFYLALGFERSAPMTKDELHYRLSLLS